MAKPLAKIYLNEDKDLVFETLVNEDVKDEIYLYGPCKDYYGDDSFRIGVTVLNPKENVAITKEAVPVLKELIDNSLCDGGDMGDISWDLFPDYSSFGWIGGNKRIFKPKEKIYRARGTRYRENYISVID